MNSSVSIPRKAFRAWIYSRLYTVVGTLILSTFCLPAWTQTQDAPNVVLILVDDLNDWVGFQNKSPLDALTPNMDELAEEGMVFTNAHASAPECAPSRTSLLSGLEPWTTGLYFNGNIWPPHVPVERMLPSVMKDNGYYVAGGGKIHHHVMGFNPPTQWDEYFEQIFEDYWTRETYRYQSGWTNEIPRPRPPWFPLNGLSGENEPTYPNSFDWGPIDTVEGNYRMGDSRMVDWGVEFLKQEKESPFFLAIGIYKPHLPWYAPKEFFDLYSNADTQLPEIDLNDLEDIPKPGRRLAATRGDDFQLIARTGNYRKAVLAYRAAISYADSQVGRILQALNDSHLAENTIVILTSDHGWHLGEKLHWHKATLWERATHVPLVIKAPEVTQPGSACDEPVGLIDIYPTILDLCSLPVIYPLDGESLTGLLQGKSEQPAQPALTGHGRGNFAVRDSRYRYIQYADGSEEIYDHKTDPQEWVNLAEDNNYQDEKRRLKAYLPVQTADQAPGRSHFKFIPKTYRWVTK